LEENKIKSNKIEEIEEERVEFNTHTHTKKRILDIGCGSRGRHNFLEGKNIVHIDIDGSADADVLMDANHLGFKQESFDFDEWVRIWSKRTRLGIPRR